MIIGIDASRAFLKNRTGIEEYSYQVIKHLRTELNDCQVVLYLRKNQEVNFDLSVNWKIKTIGWSRFWTQLGLSLEMFLHPVEVLFVPAHTVPFFHPARSCYSVAGGPQKTIVTIHGLEYEFCPEAYSFWDRIYMRASIKNSCAWASKIISVSENTKKDLMKLYKVPENKIEVVYEGYNRETRNFQFPISNFQSNQNNEISKIKTLEIQSKFKIQNSKFLLFIGRIEERKNVVNIIKAFEILKEKYEVPHKLVLAGKSGHGYEKIQKKIQETRYNNQIILTGYISDEEKWQLLENADCFLFPTQYEGFGIPILEAQSASCPVVASNNSSIPEVAGDSALLVDPQNPNEIAQAVWKIVSDEEMKKDLSQKGLENVKRFSWEKCAKEIAQVSKAVI